MPLWLAFMMLILVQALGSAVNQGQEFLRFLWCLLILSVLTLILVLSYALWPLSPRLRGAHLHMRMPTGLPNHGEEAIPQVLVMQVNGGKSLINLPYRGAVRNKAPTPC